LRTRTLGYSVVLAFAWLLSASTSARADLNIPQAKYPSVPKHARSAEGFVPKGWKLENEVKGDLNGDGVDDLVLVLHEQDQRNMVKHQAIGENPLDTNPRMLVIAFAQTDGSYALAAENHALIPRHDAPNVDDWAVDGDVSISRGALRLTVHFFASAGTWETSDMTYTFRWQQQRFELIGYDYGSVMRNSGKMEELSVNYATRKAKRTSGSIETDATKVTWEALPDAPMLSINDFHSARPGFGDGFRFDPIQSKIQINLDTPELGY
jgi:hypothetical protein